MDTWKKKSSWKGSPINRQWTISNWDVHENEMVLKTRQRTGKIKNQWTSEREREYNALSHKLCMEKKKRSRSSYVKKTRTAYAWRWLRALPLNACSRYGNNAHTLRLQLPILLSECIWLFFHISSQDVSSVRRSTTNRSKTAIRTGL